jgi:hypothetical protein
MSTEEQKPVGAAEPAAPVAEATANVVAPTADTESKPAESTPAADTTETAAADETKAEPVKEPATPIYEGSLSYQTPGNPIK